MTSTIQSKFKLNYKLKVHVKEDHYTLVQPYPYRTSTLARKTNLGGREGVSYCLVRFPKQASKQNTGQSSKILHLTISHTLHSSKQSQDIQEVIIQSFKRYESLGAIHSFNHSVI